MMVMITFNFLCLFKPSMTICKTKGGKKQIVISCWPSSNIVWAVIYLLLVKLNLCLPSRSTYLLTQAIILPLKEKQWNYPINNLQASSFGFCPINQASSYSVLTNQTMRILYLASQSTQQSITIILCSLLKRWGPQVELEQVARYVVITALKANLGVGGYRVKWAAQEDYGALQSCKRVTALGGNPVNHTHKAEGLCRSLVSLPQCGDYRSCRMTHCTDWNVFLPSLAEQTFI